MISDFVSETFLELIAGIEKFETVQKLIKNSVSKLTSRKKFTHYGITDADNYEKQFIKYASKSATINTLISLYVEQNGSIS